MAIVVQNRQRTVRINTPQVKRQLLRIMTYLGCQDQELSVVFANDRLLHELNRTYRDQDRPTNVLAFPQEPIGAVGPSAGLLGDVVISLATAEREAQTLEQSLETRVVYLLIHGLLHLLGYDHEQGNAAAQRMEALEQELLAYLSA
jgi:probable rRNA maturation factor